jgi:hypothetical protein
MVVNFNKDQIESRTPNGVWRFEICRDDREDCLSVPVAVIELEGHYPAVEQQVKVLVPYITDPADRNCEFDVVVKKRCWCGIGSA